MVKSIQNSRFKIWSLVTLIVLITLHFKLLVINNFQVSLGYILIPFWFYLTYKTTTLKFFNLEFLLLFFFFLIPFLPMNIYNWGEFFKTYTQYIISAYFVIRTYKKKIKINSIIIDKTLKQFQIILVVVVLIQFISLHIFGIGKFYNIFGDNQLYYMLEPELGKGRMKAFYLEPSYLGLITLNVYWTRSFLNSKAELFTLNLIFTILILVFCLSSFAYVGLFVLLVFDIKRMYFSKLKSFFYLFIFLIIPFFSDILFDLFRFKEFSSEETSGFFRVSLPLKVLKEIFDNGFYLGLTFGQLESVSEKVFNQFDAGTAMSNSFFLIIGYLGLIAILMYVMLIVKFFRTESQIIKSFIILTFINLNNSGAFMTLQYAFITFLIPFLAIKYHENKIINNNSSSKRQKWINKNLRKY